MKHARAVTVEDLIHHLASIPGDTPTGLSADTGSYRGYYDQVYFPKGSDTAAEVLAVARARVGTTMQGYKGGDYTYRADCFVFVAEYGDTGHLLALMEGELVTIEHPYIW